MSVEETKNLASPSPAHVPGPSLFSSLIQKSRPELAKAVARAFQERALILTLTGLVVALVGYAGALKWVCDDAYISFRYAQNLVLGNGLVYNVGERVEGYTNFLWVLELALAHLLTGLSFATLSIVLSASMTMLVFALVFRIAQRSAISHRRKWVTLIAVGLWALNKNTALWATSGLETRQFTAFLLLAIVFITESNSLRSRILASIALAAGALTRPEGVLLFASFFFWDAVRSPAGEHHGASKKELLTQRARALLALSVPFVCIVGVQYLFRFAYYGQWLPNTYYAKVVRPWPEAGFVYLGAAFLESGVYAMLPFFALGFVARSAKKQLSQWFLYWCMLVPHMIYLVKVGGDHFEFRPLDFYTPLLCLMAAEGVVFGAHLLRLFARRMSARLARGVELCAAAFFSACVLAYGVVIQTAEYALTYNVEFSGEHVQANITKATFPVAFLLPGTEKLISLYNDSMTELLPHAIAVKWREHERFSDKKQEDFGAYQDPKRRKLPKDAVMAYPFAGILPFSLQELTVIDTHGLTDATVAHHGNSSNKHRVMAHDRFPPPGYLEERGVNIEVLPSRTSASEALSIGPYAAKLGPNLWMPFKTEAPQWAEKAFADYSLMGRTNWSRKPSALVNGKPLKLKDLLGSFEENTKEDWELRGGFAVRQGAVSGQQPITGAIGQRHLGSFAPSRGALPGDQAEGSALSPVFEAGAGDVLHLLVGGGDNEDVGVELLVDETRVLVIRGKNSEELFSHWIPLDPYQGKKLRLRAFDRSLGGFGHILLDQVALFEPARRH